MPKSAFVAIAGRPSAGKSTLVNALIGEKAGAAQTEIDPEWIEPDGLGKIVGGSHRIIQFHACLAAREPQPGVERL